MNKVLSVECGNCTPYEVALRVAGMDPVIVRAPEHPASSPSGLLDGVAGLLLMGGSDVNPARYGEPRHPLTQNPDDARDRLECALIAEALSRDLPILAICRGIQILNVQHGGTLIQHLDSTPRHRVETADRGLPAHTVAIEPGTRLASIVGGAPMDVNSRHHQAVGRPGPALLVSARDPFDATIEAVERPDKRFCLAVQWHPEDQTADERQLKLFRAFAEAVGSTPAR